MQLRWLGTAGFELRSEDGTTLLIDPFLSRPPLARPQSPLKLSDIPHADAVLVTHGHFDHAFDVPTLAGRLKAPVYASASVCRSLTHHGTLQSGLVPLSPGQSVRVGDLRIQALVAQHVHFDGALVLRTLPRLLPYLDSMHRLLTRWPAGQVLGFHIASANLRLVHFGSAGGVADTLEHLRPDVALIPAQGRSDIDQVATQMAERLQPRLVVPHHWDDFYPPLSQLIPLTPLAEALSRCLPATRLHTPRIGQWWQIF